MRFWKNHYVVGMAVFAVAAFAETVEASPFTLNFSGTVTQSIFDPYPSTPLIGAIQFGSPLYSYLNFDTTAPDLAPATDTGSYTMTGFPYGMSVVIGSVVFPIMHSVNISIADNYSGGIDQYLVYAWEGLQGGLSDFQSMSILLQDDTGTAFSSDALPSTMPDLSQFSVSSFTLAKQYTAADGNFYQYEIQGNVVPEPGTVALLGVGLLAGVAGYRKKRKYLMGEPIIHTL